MEETNDDKITEKNCKKIAKFIHKLGIDKFIFIGGDNEGFASILNGPSDFIVDMIIATYQNLMLERFNKLTESEKENLASSCIDKLKEIKENLEKTAVFSVTSDNSAVH